MASTNSNLRKILIVNPRFQYRMIFNVLGLGAILAGALYLANQFLFYRLTKSGTDMGFPPDHVFFQFVRHQQNLMNWIFLGTVASVFLISALWSLIVSHRIAGSIFRLCKHLDTSTESKTISDVKFRENDYFPELADSVNSFAKSIKGTQEKGGSQ